MPTPQQNNPSCTTLRSRGTWAVMMLILAGVAAGSMAVAHWSNMANFIPKPTPDPPPAAGSAPFDQDAALAELEHLQNRFNQAATQKISVSPIRNAALRLVETYPQFAPARTLLGQIHLYTDQPQAAYDQFTLSLELDGQQPEVHLLAGTIALGLDRVDDALGHYSMAIGINPANPRYRLHIAQAYLKKREHKQARQALLETLRIDSDSHEAYAVLAELYAQQNKLSLALTAITKAGEHTPPASKTRLLIYSRQKAQLLRRDNRIDEALLVLASIDPADQSNPTVLADKATCYAQLGQPEQAAKIYERALALDPTYWQLAAAAAHWRIEAGDTKTAKQHLDTIRHLNPHAPVIAHLQDQLK